MPTTRSMEPNRLSEGRAVLLVAPMRSGQAVTRVLREDPPRIVVEAPSFEVPANAQLMLMTGPRTNRWVARARVLGCSPNGWELERTTAWVPFDARRNRRFPIRGSAQVTFAGRTLPARPIDISEGGCALAVALPPEDAPTTGSKVDAFLQYAGYGSHLPCVVVATSTEPGGSVRLHLSFGELANHQRAFVRAVVATAASERAAAS